VSADRENMSFSVRPKLTGHQRRVITLSALGGFADGYDLQILSAAVLVLVPALKLQSGATGLLTSMGYLGAFLGAIVAGRLTDRFGRRQVYVTSLILMAIGAIMSAVSPGLALLLVSRFIIGLGIGADFPTSGAMIAEFVPAARRGGALASWQLLWTVAGVIAPFIGVLLLGVGGDNSWRWILLSGLIPAIAILVARQSIPETPRWLETHGRSSEAAQVRAWAGQDDDAGAVREEPSEGFAALWRSHRRRLISLCVMCLFGSFGPLFLGTYGAFLAKFYGFTGDRSALMFGAIIWVFYLIGSVLNIALTDRIGRRPLLIGGAVIVTVTLLIASRLHLGSGTVLIVFIVLAFAALGHYGGVDQAMFQYSAELFPTRSRGTGRGITTSCTRLSAFVASLVTPPLLSGIGFGPTMLIFAGTEVIALAAALTLPEVRGKTLEAAAHVLAAGRDPIASTTSEDAAQKDHEHFSS
jgi:MFS transporter, putative metabolite transport protein